MKKLGVGLLASGVLVSSLVGYGQDIASAATVSKKTVTFLTNRTNDQMKAAEKKYEALHPNIDINIQYTESTSKFTNANKEIPAGKGPDMFLVDGFPIEKYVKQSLLVDLGAMMSKDPGFKKQDYFSNVLDNVRDGQGKMYSMPLGFKVMGLLGDADAINQTGVKFDDKKWTWNDFISIGTKLKNANGKYSSVLSDGDGLTTLILSGNPSVVFDTTNRKVRSDTAALKGLMNQVKAMKDKGILASNTDSYFSIGGGSSTWDYLEVLPNFYKKSTSFYQMPRLDGASAGGYFESSWNVSINSNSKVKQEAYDFLKFMLSEEGQNSSRTDYIPLNKQGFTKQINKLKADGSFKALHSIPEDGLPIKVDNAKLDQWASIVSGVTHKANMDPFNPDPRVGIFTFVGPAFNSYYDGKTTMDAAIKAAQTQLTTYFKQFP